VLWLPSPFTVRPPLERSDTGNVVDGSQGAWLGRYIDVQSPMRAEPMPNLTPQDVRNIAFNRPPFGRRGYDEEQVDAFIDAVAQTITALTDEVTSLRAQAGREQPGAEGGVMAELGEIKARLTRIETAIADGGRRNPTGDPLFGNPA